MNNYPHHIAKTNMDHKEIRKLEITVTSQYKFKMLPFSTFFLWSM